MDIELHIPLDSLTWILQRDTKFSIDECEYQQNKDQHKQKHK